MLHPWLEGSRHLLARPAGFDATDVGKRHAHGLCFAAEIRHVVRRTGEFRFPHAERKPAFANRNLRRAKKRGEHAVKVHPDVYQEHDRERVPFLAQLVEEHGKDDPTGNHCPQFDPPAVDASVGKVPGRKLLGKMYIIELHKLPVPVGSKSQAQSLCRPPIAFTKLCALRSFLP